MKISNVRLFFFGLFLLAALWPDRGFGQQQYAQQIDSLESRVAQLEHRRPVEVDTTALWLFGAFCALWAQNTGRNPWLWFFLGLLFSVITVLVLLGKNSADKKAKVGPALSPFTAI